MDCPKLPAGGRKEKYEDKGMSKRPKGGYNMQFKHDKNSTKTPADQDKDPKRKVFGPIEYILGTHKPCEHWLVKKLPHGTETRKQCMSHHLRRDCQAFKLMKQQAAADQASVEERSIGCVFSPDPMTCEPCEF
jgi:hypothetical protein